MEEIRKNHILQITTKNNICVEGIVFDYSKDRIKVLLSYDSLVKAKNLKELDRIFVKANTHLGIKNMKSHIISELNSENCIVIENGATIPVEQKREHVRVLSNLVFKLSKNNELFTCYCINISAGGIAFVCSETSFKLDDEVVLIFDEKYFGKTFNASGKIIKVNDDYCVAKFYNLKMYDEDRIVKYVFKLIAKK